MTNDVSNLMHDCEATWDVNSLPHFHNFKASPLPLQSLLPACTNILKHLPCFPPASTHSHPRCKECEWVRHVREHDEDIRKLSELIRHAYFCVFFTMLELGAFHYRAFHSENLYLYLLVKNDLAMTNPRPSHGQAIWPGFIILLKDVHSGIGGRPEVRNKWVIISMVGKRYFRGGGSAPPHTPFPVGLRPP